MCTLTVLCLLQGLMSAATAEAGILSSRNIDALIRLYGSVGYGTGDQPNTVSSLYYAGGGQFLKTWGQQIAYLGVGVDLGYTHFAQFKTISGKGNSRYLNAFLMGELHFFLVNLQLGVGPAFGRGDMSGTSVGLMSGLGVNLPIKPVGFSAMIRTDWVFDTKTAGSVSFMLGMTIPITF
ncbi:MAG: hypothetical protein OEZ36_14455 [Spirochaetota bacterium]|nr:hypothetical protein [Spirochaetota bacterium]